MYIIINSIETMMGYETIIIGYEKDEIIEWHFSFLLQKCQEGLEKQWKEVNLFLIVLIYCIRDFIKLV